MGKTELDGLTANNGPNWPTWWVLILVFDPQVWRTDAFKEERLKKLEVRQLLSCLKALLGTGREEQRVFFKAALQKNNEVNFTAVEALLFVRWPMNWRRWPSSPSTRRLSTEPSSRTHWWIVPCQNFSCFFFLCRRYRYASSETWNHSYVCNALIVVALKHVKSSCTCISEEQDAGNVNITMNISSNSKIIISSNILLPLPIAENWSWIIDSSSNNNVNNINKTHKNMLNIKNARARSNSIIKVNIKSRQGLRREQRVGHQRFLTLHNKKQRNNK